jgi:hypothetical protein
LLKEFVMFRASFLAGCTLGLALLMTSSASAQFRGLKFPPAVQNIMLLRNDAVKKELNINDDQTKSLDDVATQMQSDALEIFSGLQDLSPEEREKEMPSLMKMMAEKGKELQAKVDKILDAKQLTRMKELSLQQRGAAALEDDEVVEALKLTDEQKKKLNAIREELADKQQEIIKALTAGGGGDGGQIREKVQALQKELTEKALAVLTPEQTKAFDKLKGAKFDLPRGRGGLPF